MAATTCSYFISHPLNTRCRLSSPRTLECPGRHLSLYGPHQSSFESERERSPRRPRSRSSKACGRWIGHNQRGGHGGAAYKATLIEWVEKRFGGHADDPLLPFLLDNGMYSLGPTLMRQIEAGKLPRFDPDTSEVVSWLRLGVIERQKSSTGGTRLVQAL